MPNTAYFRGDQHVRCFDFFFSASAIGRLSGFRLGSYLYALSVGQTHGNGLAKSLVVRFRHVARAEQYLLLIGGQK